MGLLCALRLRVACHAACRAARVRLFREISFKPSLACRQFAWLLRPLRNSAKRQRLMHCCNCCCNPLHFRTKHARSLRPGTPGPAEYIPIRCRHARQFVEGPVSAAWQLSAVEPNCRAPARTRACIVMCACDVTCSDHTQLHDHRSVLRS